LSGERPQKGKVDKKQGVRKKKPRENEGPQGDGNLRQKIGGDWDLNAKTLRRTRTKLKGQHGGGLLKRGRESRKKLLKKKRAVRICSKREAPEGGSTSKEGEPVRGWKKKAQEGGRGLQKKSVLLQKKNKEKYVLT